MVKRIELFVSSNTGFLIGVVAWGCSPSDDADANAVHWASKPFESAWGMLYPSVLETIAPIHGDIMQSVSPVFRVKERVADCGFLMCGPYRRSAGLRLWAFAMRCMSFDISDHNLILIVWV
jgi:hypothetical protein